MSLWTFLALEVDSSDRCRPDCKVGASGNPIVRSTGLFALRYCASGLAQPDRCACARHVGHELFHVMDDDLSYQIRCHSFYASSQQELVLCGWSPKGVVIVCAKIGDLTVGWLPEHLKAGLRHSTRTARKERWHVACEAPDPGNRCRLLPGLPVEC